MHMGKIKDAMQDVAPEANMKKGFLQATNYLNSHLNEGEFPLYRAHLSWIPVFVRQIPFMLIGSLIGGVAWGVTGDFLLGCSIALGAWIIGALAQIGQIYKNIATDILLTNQGVHSKYKLFAVEDDQFSRYGYVNDARLTYNSIFQRIFQYGDVEIETIGTDANYEFKCLAKPMMLKQAVRAAQQKYGGHGGMGGGRAPQSYDGYDDFDSERDSSRRRTNPGAANRRAPASQRGSIHETDHLGTRGQTGGRRRQSTGGRRRGGQ